MPAGFINDPLPGSIFNPHIRRIACGVALDISSSMEGEPMNELNRGCKAFTSAICEDSQARMSADICVVTFGTNVETVLPFTSAESPAFEIPTLYANGLTALYEGVNTVANALEAQKQLYRDNEVAYWRPWLFLLSDGGGTDKRTYGSDAIARIRDDIYNCRLNFIPMGIGPHADINALLEFYPEAEKNVRGEKINKVYLKASKENFKEAFVWLSSSMSLVVQAGVTPGTTTRSAKIPDSISIGT